MSVLDELVEGEDDGDELELELAPPEPLALWSAEPALPPVVPPPLEDEALLGEDALPALPEGDVEEPAPAEPLIEPEAEPEGEAVEPDGAELDDEAEPDGEVDGEVVAPVDELELEPDGAVLVVPPREAEESSARSHAVRKAPPKATETARAKVESFMGPP